MSRCRSDTLAKSRVFYVYLFFDLEGAPLYVGKGYGKRVERFASSGRNPHFIRIALKAEKSGKRLPCVMLREGLTEQEAFEIEIAFIIGIGRRIDGTGPLLNLTLGGEGKSGFKASQETRQKISAKHVGKTVPIEVRLKTSATLSGRSKPESFGRQISKIQTGRAHSDERKANISAALMGHVVSAEDAAKKSKTLKKLFAENPEHRAATIAINTARWQDPKYKAKMADIRRELWADPQYREMMQDRQKSSWSPERRAEYSRRMTERHARNRERQS